MTVEKEFSFEDIQSFIESNDLNGLKAAFQSEGSDINMANRLGKTALHIAALYDKVEVLKFLTSHSKVNINATDHFSKTPLMFAAEYGRSRSVELLLQMGADASACDKNGCNALWYACMSGNLKCVEAVLRNRNCMPVSKEQKVYKFMLQSGIIEIVRKLIIESTDIYYASTFGITALYFACEAGSIDTVKLILEKDIKFNINDGEYSGRPLLHTALRFSFLDIADYLIQKGSIPYFIDSDRRSAYDYAAQYDDSEIFLEKYEPDEDRLEEMFKLLIKFARYRTLRAYAQKCAAGKYPNGPKILNRTLSYAIEKRNAKAIENLLSQNIDKDYIFELARKSISFYWDPKSFEPFYDRFLELKPTEEYKKECGNALLIAALDRGNTCAAKYILDQGLDPNGAESGDSYLIWACRRNNTVVVEALIELGADVHCFDTNLQNALHYAARFNNIKTAKILLKCGVDPLAKDDQGYTPLLKAAHCGNEDVFLELFKLDKDLSQKSKDLMTPFLAACNYGNMKIIKALCEAGACLTDFNSRKRNCFHFIATDHKICDLMAYLIEKIDEKDFDAMIVAADVDGYRPVDRIRENQSKEMVSKLVLAFPKLADFFSVPTRIRIQNSSQEMCLICRDEFLLDECVIVLPCKHVFHENCFREWSKQKKICPYCQRSTNE